MEKEAPEESTNKLEHNEHSQDASIKDEDNSKKPKENKTQNNAAEKAISEITHEQEDNDTRKCSLSTHKLNENCINNFECKNWIQIIHNPEFNSMYWYNPRPRKHCDETGIRNTYGQNHREIIRNKQGEYEKEPRIGQKLGTKCREQSPDEQNADRGRPQFQFQSRYRTKSRNRSQTRNHNNYPRPPIPENRGYTRPINQLNGPNNEVYQKLCTLYISSRTRIIPKTIYL